MSLYRNFATFIAAIFFMLIAGCGSKDMSDLNNYIGAVKARPPGKIDALPEVVPVDTFVYVPAGRRDPFVNDVAPEPDMMLTMDNGLAPDMSRPREELEQFPLDSLRMVGTLEQEGMLWGLVRTTEGKLYRTKTGNYLGKNYGRIISISEDAIELIELITETPGMWQERPARIALSQ